METNVLVAGFFFFLKSRDPLQTVHVLNDGAL